LRNARLIANPGCYPTSILLALRPLTYAIDREQPVICDSKSGVSGAGKKSDLSWSFAELYGNFKAYGVGQHRHEPEIRQGLRLGDRQPAQRRGLAGRAELQPHVRIPGDGGLGVRVIKLGGSLLEDAPRRAEVLRGIAKAWKGGEQLVLVHGGGKHIDAMLKRL